MAASSLDGQLYSSLLNAGASFTHTVTITDERMAEYNAAVNALKPSKRDKFKTYTKDGRGCRRTIHYSAEPIAVGSATTNFYQKADAKQAAARHIPQGTRISVISQSMHLLGLAPSGDFTVATMPRLSGLLTPIQRRICQSMSWSGRMRTTRASTIATTM